MQAPQHQFVFAHGAVLAGKYEIIRRIGSGGMGEVYEARHVRMNKRLAIKALARSSADSPDAVARFLREAEAASRIRHPNVIEVFDVDESFDPPYMVMEFLEGCSLQSLVDRTGGLSIRCCATLLTPVLHALQAAHDKRIIHRDLKPDNIFLSIAGDNSVRPVVLDFGIAKVTDSIVVSLSQTRVVLGTVMYMSPEQIVNSSTVSPAADQYSLGTIAYECVAGRVAFGGESIAAVFDSIRAGSYPPLSTVIPAVDPVFERVLQRAMALDPKERFESVRAFADALAPFACNSFDEIASELESVLIGGRAVRGSAPTEVPRPSNLAAARSPAPMRIAEHSATHARAAIETQHAALADTEEASAPKREARAPEPPMATPVEERIVDSPHPTQRWPRSAALFAVIVAASIIAYQQRTTTPRSTPVSATPPAPARLAVRTVEPSPQTHATTPQARSEQPATQVLAPRAPPDAGAEVTIRARTNGRAPRVERHHVGGGFVL